MTTKFLVASLLGVGGLGLAGGVYLFKDNKTETSKQEINTHSQTSENKISTPAEKVSKENPSPTITVTAGNKELQTTQESEVSTSAEGQKLT